LPRNRDRLACFSIKEKNLLLFCHYLDTNCVKKIAWEPVGMKEHNQSISIMTSGLGNPPKTFANDLTAMMLAISALPLALQIGVQILTQIG
jgi:hypothetical protein